MDTLPLLEFAQPRRTSGWRDRTVQKGAAPMQYLEPKQLHLRFVAAVSVHDCLLGYAHGFGEAADAQQCGARFAAAIAALAHVSLRNVAFQVSARRGSTEFA